MSVAKYYSFRRIILKTTYMLRPFGSRSRSRFQEDIYVPINVSLSEDTFQISAYLPGVSAEDVEIEIIEDRIEIEGDIPEFELADGQRLLHRELPSGHFHRSMRLGSKLDSAKAEATVTAGILHISVPKAEEAKTHKIAVKAK